MPLAPLLKPQPHTHLQIVREGGNHHILAAVAVQVRDEGSGIHTRRHLCHPAQLDVQWTKPWRWQVIKAAGHRPAWEIGCQTGRLEDGLGVVRGLAVTMHCTIQQ